MRTTANLRNTTNRETTCFYPDSRISPLHAFGELVCSDTLHITRVCFHGVELYAIAYLTCGRVWVEHVDAETLMFRLDDIARDEYAEE